MKRADIESQRENIVQRLKCGESRSSICRELKCKYDTLKKYLDLWGFGDLKNQSGKGFPKFKQRKNCEQYLGKETKISSHNLKLKLFSEGIKKEECEWCKNSMWNYKKIPLELDHINGNKKDNRIENLRVLCPNCHAQTDTYKIKNRKRAFVDQPAESADLKSV